MALSNSAKVKWRSLNKRIDVLLHSAHDITEFINLTSANLVFDLHHQTGVQVDVRVAGEYDPYYGGVVTVPKFSIQSHYVQYDGIDADSEALVPELALRNHVYDDATDTTVMRLFTTECYLTDRQFGIDDQYTGTAVSIIAWINKLIAAACPPGISKTLTNTAGISGNVLADEQRGLLGTSFLTNIDNILMRKNARLVAGPGGFEILPRDSTAMTYPLPAEALEDGPSKLLLKAEVEEDRERFYNAVTLRYWYSNAAGTTEVLSSARVALGSGPLAPDVIGYKIYTEEISGGTDAVSADAASRTVLRSMLKRRDLLKMSLALCPWVRVGHRIVYGGATWTISKLQMDLISDTMNLEAEPYAVSATIENYTPTI